MTIKSKSDIKDLVDRVSTLSADDLIVLKNLGADKSKRTIELASELFILPRIIDESVKHLRERGFIVETRQNLEKGDLFIYSVMLTSEGEDAKTLLPLVEKTMNQ